MINYKRKLIKPKLNFLDRVEFVSYNSAVSIIMKFHYSKVMPKITKFCIGGYIHNELVAVCTLGYGVRPFHTIKKIFPSLGVKDYLEIGKLCLSDNCPRNTESYFISRIIKIIKKFCPDVKILFSWADGIIGKPGYVYQASNFYYGGYILTEMYLDKNGIRLHPRTVQGISIGNRVGKNKSRAKSVTMTMGLKKYFGLQFRYIFPLCDKKEWNTLLKESPFEWHRNNYPKIDDCIWYEQNNGIGKTQCEKPPFIMTSYPIKTKFEQPKLDL